MRTTIDVDEELLEAAMRASTKRTKREVFEEALRLLVERDAQRQLLRFRGTQPGVDPVPRRRLPR